jgi:hypothetical protein
MKQVRREELSSHERVSGRVGRSQLRRARRILALFGFATLGVAVAVGIAGPALASSDRTTAHTARILTVRDEGRLHYVRSSREQIIDEGNATGSFPGRVRVRFVYNGEPTVAARFTIYGKAGSINARGLARLSTPTSPSPSFRGNMTITGGSGRYSHIHGGGELYGVYHRRSYALTVQAIGKFPY